MLLLSLLLLSLLLWFVVATATVDDTVVPAADCVDTAVEAINAAEVNPMPHDDGAACRLLTTPTMTLAMKTYRHINIHMKYIYYGCHRCLHTATAEYAVGVLLPPWL